MSFIYYADKVQILIRKAEMQIEDDLELYDTLLLVADPNVSFEEYFGYNVEERQAKIKKYRELYGLRQMGI